MDQVDEDVKYNDMEIVKRKPPESRNDWHATLMSLTIHDAVRFKNRQERNAFLSAARRRGVAVATRKENGTIYGWRLPEKKK